MYVIDQQWEMKINLKDTNASGLIVKWTGDICQCIKRHLTEAEYEYYKSTYNTVLIGKTDMLENEMDEAGSYKYSLVN